MLREWLKNVPLATIEQILADERISGRHLWRLARDEFERRQQAAA